MEQSYLTPFVAIDLSAAFDTVHHKLLLNVLKNCFGVCDKAYQWISSYLSDRSFCVDVNGHKSSPVNIDFSVPQGSINGPVYFTCYSSTLGASVDPEFELVGYADDHSIYGKYKAGDLNQENDVMKKLRDTLGTTKRWMVQNRLKMNENKTEFVMFGSRRLLDRCSVSNITVGDSTVLRSLVIRFLGVQLDEHLYFKQHISPANLDQPLWRCST